MDITDKFIAATELIGAALANPDAYPDVVAFLDEHFEVLDDPDADGDGDCDD